MVHGSPIIGVNTFTNPVARSVPSTTPSELLGGQNIIWPGCSRK